MLAWKKKKERLNFLKKTINELSKNKSKLIVGGKEEILVESISSKYNNMVLGRTRNNKLISVPGNKNLIGKIIDVKITELSNRSLKGEIINI